jgi:hypothetical protein
MLAPADIFNWDWTAIGTLALAVVTALSLRLGYLALRGTRTELEANQRPVIVPVASNAEVENPAPLEDGPDPYRSSDTIQARPTALVGGMLMIPVRNIGAGPALSVTVILRFRNDDGQYAEAWGNRMYDGYLYAAAVGDTAPVLVAVDRLTARTPNFDLMIVYRDLAGRNFCTQAQYREAGTDGRYGIYYNPKVDPLSGEEDPGEAILAPQRQIEADLQAGVYQTEPLPPEDEAVYG